MEEKKQLDESHVDKQVFNTISPERQDGESFKQYKERIANVNKLLKIRRKGWRIP